MSKTDQLPEQQIRLHEAELKHIDELLERARGAHGERQESDPLLDALKEERDALANLLHSMRGESPESWEEAAEQHLGPMGVWQIMARLLEKAIERAEQHR